MQIIFRQIILKANFNCSKKFRFVATQRFSPQRTSAWKTISFENSQPIIINNEITF